MIRTRLVAALAERILQIERSHPLRVAVDGIDAAGKTTLADELAAAIGFMGRTPLRASLDSFHRPRSERYRRGQDSPEGYFFDTFNIAALIEVILKPLGPGGDRFYQTAVFDLNLDRTVKAPACLAPPDAVLVVDGVFLLQPELDPYWDYRIFLQVDFDEALRRVKKRDRHRLGSIQEVERRYLQRYFPGQRIYLESARPLERAEAVVEHNDPGKPGLNFRGE